MAATITIRCDECGVDVNDPNPGGPKPVMGTLIRIQQNNSGILTGEFCSGHCALTWLERKVKTTGLT